jgi:hypothetical protein
MGHPGVGLIVEDAVHDGRLPRMSPRAWPPGTFVEPLDDLTDRHPFLHQPGEDLTYQNGLVFVDHEITWHAVTLGDVAISIRRLAAEPVALASFLKLATSEPLADDGALVLGHGPLDLQKQLILRVVRDRPMEEDDLTAGLAEFLEEQDLIGVLASETVRTQDCDDIDRAQLRCVS